MEVVLFDNDGSISILMPASCRLTVDQIARKDIPKGCPYIIVDREELPDAPVASWEVDFSNPDGYGEKEVSSE